MNIFHFPRGRSRELSTRTDSPFFFHGTETKGRESFVEYGSRPFLERRFNRSPLSRSSLLSSSSFAIPNSSFVVNALERGGKGTVHYLETKKKKKKKKQLSTSEIRETLIFFDRSSSGKGARRKGAIDTLRIKLSFVFWEWRGIRKRRRNSPRSWSIEKKSRGRNRSDWLTRKEIIFIYLFLAWYLSHIHIIQNDRSLSKVEIGNPGKEFLLLLCSQSCETFFQQWTLATSNNAKKLPPPFALYSLRYWISGEFKNFSPNSRTLY